MSGFNVLEDIAKRTDGDIYVGVVGPVRTGKSTFIKNFMNQLVIPNIDNSFKQERAKDELPQSAQGKTIMTTEPKFIPNEAVKITTEDNVSFNVRLIDCVGYVVNSALGHIENNEPRMVNTPWYEEPVPFIKAAEIGTEKVIKEHSTIGLVVTTDGTVADIAREDYVDAERRVVSELKEIGKPFIILLNSATPKSEETQRLREGLEEEYKVPVMAVNCLTLEKDEMLNIIENILTQFPIKEILFKMPDWLNALSNDNELKEKIYKAISLATDNMSKVSDIKNTIKALSGCDFVKNISVSESHLGEGKISVETVLKDGLFYEIISKTTDFAIKDDKSLITTLTELSEIKKEYDKLSVAISEVKRKGYGIVSPTIDELTLSEPEIVKQGNKFGVRLHASAPSIHIMCNKPKSLEAA